MRLLLSSLLFLSVAACTFSAPQFASGVRFVKTITVSGGSNSEQTKPRWLASVGAEGSTLAVYSVEGLTVFANADGDAIAFDGWTVRSIVGFGLADPISISGKEGERRFATGGSVKLVECYPWQFMNGAWSQRCDNGVGTIELDEDGYITTIYMSLDQSIGNVTLRVVK